MINTLNKIFFAISLFVFAACNSEEKNGEPIEVKNGIVPIAYNKTGNGDTALVFVHGWGINKEYWKSQADEFSKRYTVVTIDLGGHGKSGTQRDHWTVDDYANDVMAVLDSLNLNKVILVGHSMGGDVILDIAFKIPDGKMKGTFIWEPLNTWEFIFDKDGKANELLKLYPEMAKKYDVKLLK